MIDLNKTSALGRCVKNWDVFYNSNYAWLYQSFLSSTQHTIIARNLAERALTQMVLTYPEIIADNDSKAFRHYISILYPYMAMSVDKSKGVNAGRLLQLFYHPN